MKNGNAEKDKLVASEVKVPIIRLKLKVSAKTAEPVPLSAVSDENGDQDKIKYDSDMLVEPLEPLESQSSQSPQSLESHSQSHSPSSQAHSQSHSPSPQSQSQSPSSPIKFYGTFKYRPFKLFPLLPPTSRYRVLIPSLHSSPTTNPAIKLNYLWKTTEAKGVYTDDSDLVCVLIKEGWVGEDELKGKSVLVEVEVVDMPDINHSEINTPITSTVINIAPRSYPSHDGNHIRITACTLNPSAVHLKRWRKRPHHHPIATISTPKFKTKAFSFVCWCLTVLERSLSLGCFMNAKQLRAHRRRQRQKQKKQLSKTVNINNNLAIPSDNDQTTATTSMLNKRVTFDHFTFDSSGITVIPLTGTITKLTDDLLTIHVDPTTTNIDHLSHSSRSKRSEALLGSIPTVLQATIPSLLNFKFLN